MSATSQLEYEAAGIALLIVAGVASAVVTALASPLSPWISWAWVFALLVAALLGGMALNERLDDGSDPDEGGVLDVDLVNWANELVGTTCLRCEDEITYVPLGTTGGQSEHRIECGCTVIESTAKG